MWGVCKHWTGLLDYWTTGLTIITRTSGMSVGGGKARPVMCNLRTLHNQGSVVEVDANRSCKTSACQTCYRTRAVGASEYIWTVHWTQADVVKEATPQKHAYLCLQRRENCCAPHCANANGEENSSDLCIMERAASSGLLTLVKEGAVAEASEASKATCTCNYCQ